MTKPEKLKEVQKKTLENSLMQYYDEADSYREGVYEVDCNELGKGFEKSYNLGASDVIEAVEKVNNEYTEVYHSFHPVGDRIYGIEDYFKKINSKLQELKKEINEQT